MKALLKKELRSLFFSPLAYMVAGIVALMNGRVFCVLLQLLASPMSQVQEDLLSLFFGGTFFFWLSLIAMVPMLTMRLISEEKRSGCIELLMTAPITDCQIICAKFFSVFIFYIFLWIPSFLYTFLLIFLGNFDWNIWILCLLGVLSIGAMLLSMGLMFSCFFTHQLASGGMTLAMLLFYFMLGFSQSLVQIPWFQTFLDIVWPLSIMRALGAGQLDLAQLVFLLMMTFFHLYVAVKILESRRWKN
ncbi:hypothetical protein AB834_04780 [PVC group bacterium (ex Bugula neritina AB1)]|nr:hypothetical protein AB834_04780 [PVC group bacterium (ex Bugula neritina AB1)]